LWHDEGFFTISRWLHGVGEHELSNENNEPPNQEDYDDNDYVIEEEDLAEPEGEPAEVVFEKGKGYAASENADRLSQQGFYGTRIEGNRLELEPVELLHLMLSCST